MHDIIHYNVVHTYSVWYIPSSVITDSESLYSTSLRWLNNNTNEFRFFSCTVCRQCRWFCEGKIPWPTAALSVSLACQTITDMSSVLAQALKL